jgi:hypothetical protein
MRNLTSTVRSQILNRSKERTRKKVTKKPKKPRMKRLRLRSRLKETNHFRVKHGGPWRLVSQRRNRPTHFRKFFRTTIMMCIR